MYDAEYNRRAELQARVDAETSLGNRQRTQEVAQLELTKLLSKMTRAIESQNKRIRSLEGKVERLQAKGKKS